MPMIVNWYNRTNCFLQAWQQIDRKDELCVRHGSGLFSSEHCRRSSRSPTMPCMNRYPLTVWFDLIASCDQSTACGLPDTIT